MASVQVAQPLSQLYQIHLAIREQELSTDLAAEQYRGQRQSIVASVKQAYYAHAANGKRSRSDTGAG